jgi:hypothetical protein
LGPNGTIAPQIEVERIRHGGLALDTLNSIARVAETRRKLEAKR